MFFLSFLFAVGSNIQDVYHPFDQSIQFQTRDFEVKQHNNDGSLYTMCVQKTESSQQCVLSYKEKPQPLHYEKVLKRANPGVDGRRRVEKPSEWPYCVHGHMDMLFAAGLHAGSGILVGPHHFLTCAHNVFHNKEWAKGLTVYLGLDNETAPYGAVSAAGIYVYTNWLENENPDYDIALVVLKQSVGKKTGWAGMLCADTQSLAKKTVEITGYPADKSEGLKQMWTMSHTIESVFEERMTHLIDTSFGQSGGGICENALGNFSVVGVHTNGSTLIENNNSGIRLSTEKFTRIVTKWMRDTGRIQQKRSQAFNQITSAEIFPDIQETIRKRARLQTVADVTESEIKQLYDQITTGNADAFNRLKILAEQENAEAQNALGVCYLMGNGIGKSADHAIAWWTISSNNGNEKAKNNLIRSCENTIEHQTPVSEHTDPKIIHNIGMAYHLGVGREKNDAIAFECFQRSIALGNLESQFMLGACYYHGEGIEKNEKEAVRLWKEASVRGDILAQKNLAQCYLWGTGTDRIDFDKAKEYLQMAANQGDKDAQENLRNFDQLEAQVWENMASQGIVYAQYNIGVMYFNGEGVTQNTLTAKKWLQIRVLKRLKRSCVQLRDMRLSYSFAVD